MLSVDIYVYAENPKSVYEYYFLSDSGPVFQKVGLR